MIPVEQRHMAIFDEHGDNVQPGDCLTACVAALLEIPIDEVPFFVDGENWHGEYQRFFHERGFQLYRAWFTPDDDDPTQLSGHPSGDIHWIATVKSPRGKTRCAVCKGEGEAIEQWIGAEERYVKYDTPQPCVNCETTGLEPSLHCVLMRGGELVWDPHPQREMGHLGFVSGELLAARDPAKLALRLG